MTMGQRIAQKRRELGLSQEGLGERLGVSRQAIYKWESDAALPEIEKLVKLGREFSVSIDWLLGEEGAAEKPELTQEQLRMVEEIVGRYLDARPAPFPEETPSEEREAEPEPQKPKKRRRWSWGAALLAAGAALLSYNLFGRLEQMNRDYQNLQMSVAEIRYDVNRQISGITNRVEEVLQSQNSLTVEQSAEIASTDYRANTVTVSARAMPRTYVDGMTAEFILVSGGETVTVPGELGAGHAFTAEVTGPLSDDITVTVVFISGNQRQTQLLNQFFRMYSASFPKVDMDSNGLWGWGRNVDEYARLEVGTEGAVRLASLRLGLFQDQKLLAWYDRLEEQPAYYQGVFPSGTEFFHLDGAWTMEEGHIYCQAAVLTDEYGRELVCPGFPVAYDPERMVVDYYAPDGVLSVDPDPAHWDY